MASRLERFELKLARRDSKLQRRRTDGMARRDIRRAQDAAKVDARTRVA